MNWRLPNEIFALALLFAAGAAAFAQSAPQSSGPQEADKQAADARQTPQVVYTTPPKISVAMFKLGDSEACEVRVNVTFTLTAANYDDTVVGTLVFTIPEVARKKIAEASGEPLTSIPARAERKDVAAGFRKGTSCPEISLEIGATELEVAGAKMSFDRVVVNIVETLEEVPQHFCVWTRQINANRSRRGVIASLNRLITVEP
ncbi:MAG TPA: hypothetical protein VJZ77_02055 [Blastocatellia bacterium]|nr:hypothetical protein [Blastocatellia bacterium]